MATRGLPTRPREKTEKEVQEQIKVQMNHDIYGQTELDLVCRLDKKRRELEKEITDFKARKDEEHRLFERNLKAHYMNTGQLPNEGEEPEIKAVALKEQTTIGAPATPPVTHQKEKTNHTQENGNGVVVAPSPPVQALHGAASNSRSKSSPGGSPGPPEPAKRKQQPNEHELELHGVFTPKYLPLLDGTTHEGTRRSSSELLEAANLDKHESSPAKRSTSTVLSSSAEYHNQPMISPPAPPARPLSASVPQDEPLGHRRSSSGSGESRRSNLRNPKEPRSPKRVLFSINDTLVSPSTSPVAQRSTTHSKTVRSTDSFGENDNFEIVKNKQGKVSPVTKSAIETTSLLSTSFSGPSNGWNSDMSPLRWAYESDNTNKISLLAGGDDFEHVDRDDDLFAFDEDLDAVNSGKVKKEDSQGPDSAEEEAVEDVESQEMLVGSSPYAGSLPIEIKWPRKPGSFRGGTP